MKNQILNNKNIEIAKDFYNCAISYYNSDKFIDFAPYIVNISLSCELLMKILLYNNGIEPKTIKSKKHNLYDLYNLLRDEQKQEIKEALNNYDIDVELNNANKAFNDLRYYYLNSLLYGHSA